MPLLSIEASKAFQNLQENPVNGWPNRSDGSNRIEPVAKPAFSPTFQLESGEPVFTIGSCFARNVEQELERLGFSVPMRHVRLADDTSSLDNNQQVLNNYGVASIYNELQWALDPASPFDPDAGLLELTPGKFVDLHLSKLPRSVSRDVAVDRRRRIGEAVATAGRCRALIMTLGLVEVWWDDVAKRYLNVAPPKQFALRQPGRFSLHVLSYSEIISFLHKTVDLLKQYGLPGHHILLTVSPVPLAKTFTEQDVAVANCYSKSVLRAAAEEITRSYDHIDYFPSYESIVLSDRSAAWAEDMIHVTPQVIQLNVQRMISAYTRNEFNLETLAKDAAHAEKTRLWARAVELYQAVLEHDANSTSARLGLARSLGAERDCAKALALLASIDDEEHRGAVLRAKLQIFRMNGLKAEFEEIAPEVEALHNASALNELAEGAFHFRNFDRVRNYSEELARTKATAGTGLMWSGRVALEESRWLDAVGLFESAIEVTKQSHTLFFYLGQAMAGAGNIRGARQAFEQAQELAPHFQPAKSALQRLMNMERISQ